MPTTELQSYERTPAMDAAATLRLPTFERGTLREVKADAVGDYILENGHVKGDLAEERLLTHELLAPLEDRWAKLEGWEPFRVGKTDRSIDEAKRVLDEELHDAVRVLRWRVTRLGEEIERLEGDYVRASRYYTTLAGS